jgi:hypothetical protein
MSADFENDSIADDDTTLATMVADHEAAITVSAKKIATTVKNHSKVLHFFSNRQKSIEGGERVE